MQYVYELFSKFWSIEYDFDRRIYSSLPTLMFVQPLFPATSSKEKKGIRLFLPDQNSFSSLSQLNLQWEC